MLILKRVIYESNLFDFQDFESLVLDALKEATEKYKIEKMMMFSKKIKAWI